jgi:CubicO group peptidase (beta-lactamase class C family)
MRLMMGGDGRPGVRGRAGVERAEDRASRDPGAGRARDRGLLARTPQAPGRLHAGPRRPGPPAGAITLVARHGKVVSYETFGKTAIGGAPMTKDTIFRIYSQTKPVTGVAMMILFEEGKWRLDDPVTKFVPELANLKVYKGQNPDGTFITEPAARAPTLREIMSHTGGFAYGLRTDQPVEKAYRDSGLLGSKTQAEFLATLAKLPLASQPGTEWRYSVSVDIQGLIVERLSGMSLAEFMKRRIFDPLKMTDTAFWVPPAKSDRLAALYMIPIRRPASLCRPTTSWCWTSPSRRRSLRAAAAWFRPRPTTPASPRCC